MNTPTLVTHESLHALSMEAASRSRLRKNLNLHPQLDDPIQRMFNAMEPGTYVRPHRHARANGWELMMCIKGAFSILLFDDTGTVTHRYDLAAEQGDLAVEIPAHTWHALVSHRSGTVMFEIKHGPYSPLDDKDFAAWAPSEEQSGTQRFVDWYTCATLGDRIDSAGD